MNASDEWLHSFIAPQIRMQRPLGPEYANDDSFYVTLDPQNGLVAGYKTTLSGKETRAETIVSSVGFYTDSGSVIIKNIPDNSSLCQEGQLYRDGNIIKIKIS